MAIWRAVLLAGLLALHPTHPLVADEPARILLTHSFGPSVAPFGDYVRQLKADLANRHARLELVEVLVPHNEDDQDFLRDLNVRTAQRPPNLVITVGSVAARFFQRNRRNIVPSVPVLISAVDDQLVDQHALMPHDIVVATHFDFHAVVDNILNVAPNTTHVAVVMGSSPLMIARSATLPDNSAILFGIVWFDGAGIAYTSGRPFTAIHAVANAPMFSFSDSALGRGLVGGPMLSMEALSREVTAAASTTLRDGASHAGRLHVVGPSAPVFDWRELQRWNIPESALPPGSLVKFRKPGAWTLYRWQIISAIALMLGQAALIHWLLTEHRKRRVSEASAHRLTQTLIAVQEDERARLARELHDDVTQRLAVLAIEAGSGEKAVTCETGRSTMRLMRRDLVRLCEDVHALAYRLHPSLLQDLGLREALKTECEHFVRTCPIRLELNADDVADKAPLDIGLCLFRIVQQSLRNTARHASAHQVDVSLRGKDGGLQLTVTDDGVGFDPGHSKNGVRLGHASMCERIALLHGTLDIDSRPGWGTAVTAWIPLEPNAPA